MIRLGVAWSETSHFPAFSCFFNGFPPKWAESYSKTADKPELIPGARVEYVWSENHESAVETAKDFNIKVVDSIEEMIDKIDAGLALDRYGRKHLALARFFLEAGLPTFVDKPFSDNLSDIYEMVSIAKRKGAPLMSCSPLRYAAEWTPLRKVIAEKGDNIWGGCFVAAGNFRPEEMLYGIHVIESLSSLIGSGIAKVYTTEYSNSQGKHLITRLTYRDGKVFVLHMGNPHSAWHVVIGGKGWLESATARSYYHFYRETMVKFIEMVKTRQSPIPMQNTLEVMRVCMAGQASLECGKELSIDEAFPVPVGIP